MKKTKIKQYGFELNPDFDFAAQVIEEREIRPKAKDNTVEENKLHGLNSQEIQDVEGKKADYSYRYKVESVSENIAPAKAIEKSLKETIVQRTKSIYKKNKEYKTKLGVKDMAFGRDDLRDTNRTYENPERGEKLVGVETERRLTVGTGITLKGEISDCDKLVIFGDVDAVLNNVTSVHITESGLFNGSAEVETCEVSGVFEGELRVRGHITINSTGRVNGKITYGSIEIRPGGKFTGEIVEEEYKLGGKAGKLSRPVSGTKGSKTSASEEASAERSLSFESVEI